MSIGVCSCTAGHRKLTNPLGTLALRQFPALLHLSIQRNFASKIGVGLQSGLFCSGYEDKSIVVNTVKDALDCVVAMSTGLHVFGGQLLWWNTEGKRVLALMLSLSMNSPSAEPFTSNDRAIFGYFLPLMWQFSVNPTSPDAFVSAWKNVTSVSNKCLCHYGLIHATNRNSEVTRKGSATTLMSINIPPKWLLQLMKAESTD